MKHSVDVTVVLDRSGSMDSVKMDTIGGFNQFLKEQQALPGEATLSLIQFDDKYEPNYRGKPIKDAPGLNEDTYIPRGWTALLDAIGRTIDETGERLAALPETERPAKVLMLIMTDGFENASKKYNRAQVFEMITHQREHYKGEIIFIGANQDAISEGSRLGVAMGQALNFNNTPDSVKAAYAVNSRKLYNMRQMVNSGDEVMVAAASFGTYTAAEQEQVTGGTQDATQNQNFQGTGGIKPRIKPKK